MARLLLILTFALAMLAGCGGDDDGGGGGGGGEEMTQEEFVSEANKICKEGSEKINDKSKEIQQKIQEAGSDVEAQQKALAEVLEDTAKEYDPYLDRLGDLNPPDDIQADWDKFMDGINKAFDLIPELADATRDGDRDKLEDLTADFSKIANDTQPFASKYKLDECLPENSPTS
jgi:TolA-binding protein